MATKKQSGYVMPLKKTIDQGGLNCQNCYYYENEKCLIVKGYIDPMATCNLWSRTGTLNLNFLSGEEALKKLQKSKISKMDAGYTDARHTISIVPTTRHKGVRCDSCIKFIDKNKDKNASLQDAIRKNACQGVAGNINRNACCNLWTDTKDTTIDYASGKEIKKILLHKDRSFLTDIEDLV